METSPFAVAPPHLNLAWVRAQFPALSQVVSGLPAIFFDGPGGTQVTSSVIAAISDYLTRSNANTHGYFATSQRTDEVLARAHRDMADFLHCEPGEIAFGANMTTLTFAISRALGRELQPGDEILTTALDHDANVAPWRALEHDRGVKVLTVDIHDDNCTLDLADFENKLNSRTRIVAVGFASNAVGTINPLQRIIPMAHAAGALVYVDAVHYAPHRSIDVRRLNCDFLACSTYKFFGPHVGVLYGRRQHLERLNPYKVRPASSATPDRWETGTQNHEGLAGVSACVQYLRDLSPHDANPIEAAFAGIQQHENDLAGQFLGGLSHLPQFRLYGIAKPSHEHQRTPTFGLRHATRSPAELAQILAGAGIFTWSGNFYALSLTERLGLETSGGLLRIGFAHYNTAEEVDRLLARMKSIS